MRPIWPRLAEIPVNTVLTPLSWELIEPEEGKFDFSLIDGLLAGARQNHLHIVFLWFGSWKNGTSSYAPAWVKQDTRRFPRMMDKDGAPLEILSTLGKASMQADARAFAAVMRHIRDVDGDAHTVLMMQVENEVGVAPDSRDRSPAANEAFEAPVPRELMVYLQQHRDTLLPEFRQVWEAAGSKSSGSWPEVFGNNTRADEIFMAWNYARYIQMVAAAGKAEYPIPMYVNSALFKETASNLGEKETELKPGKFSSGGPLPIVMDVWRAAGSAIDIYSPDVYEPNLAAWCDRYHRVGNPLFIPEAVGGATGGQNVFYAFGTHDAIGFSPFAIDAFVDNGRPNELDANNDLGKSYEVLQSLAPIILQHQGHGEMVGFKLDTDHPHTTLELNGYDLEVQLDRLWDWKAKTAAGLIIATGPDEFLGAGTGFMVSFHLKGESTMRVGIRSIEEGTLAGGAWMPGRRMNGDEDDQGRFWRFIPDRMHIEKVAVYQYTASNGSE
jgi:hypothetical protein